jgi:uroporphyrinogen-III decarboxylase
MDWIQHLAGIENGHFMLCDYREEVEALFENMHAFLCRRAEIIAEKCPAPVVYSVENTSTTLISPELFRQYPYQHLMDYGNVLSSAGKLHVLHMCGHLYDVLADVAKLPAVAIEAFTSPPVGNTTLKDGRTACSNKCLIGGTNAVLWTKTADEIFHEIKHDLDELAHQRGVVVTSAGVMTPLCKPETIKEVADLVKAYTVSNN